ncbi:hypothetical protein MNBD_GAMMA09-2825 [hydrothermal vent metagenome]|uniref:Uncharacterized protein n=1 Tax=hydrothermal vent metagenome TaxID=652676 RepID=A0A3B0YEI2_9ZZZZ
MSDPHKPEIPQPAQPQQRKEPLPWCCPKPALEDPECPDKLKAILNSPSYVPATRDVTFLQGDDARGLRLQMDYLNLTVCLKPMAYSIPLSYLAVHGLWSQVQPG